MHTVRLPMCSTVAPMARIGGGDITGNVLGQGFTSPSPCTHVQGGHAGSLLEAKQHDRSRTHRGDSPPSFHTHAPRSKRGYPRPVHRFIRSCHPPSPLIRTRQPQLQSWSRSAAPGAHWTRSQGPLAAKQHVGVLTAVTQPFLLHTHAPRSHPNEAVRDLCNAPFGLAIHHHP